MTRRQDMHHGSAISIAKKTMTTSQPSYCTTFLTNKEIFRMKKTLTFLSLLVFGLLFVSGISEAQIRTGRGDFFNITRTVEQTADSVTFAADTLTILDSGAGLGNFQTNDSIAVMFVQDRFKIANNMINATTFDYIRVQVRNNTGMTLARQAYNGVVTNVTGGIPVFGTDPGQAGPKIGLRPVYRPVGAIASSSTFNSDPSAIRQFLTFQVQNPAAGVDGVQIRNIFFKPNINNLTGLAMPPDTTKDTLRAYHLDGGLVSAGDVVGALGSGYADLAIVRLLPGTTRILMWVKDSAQAVDAGEYIGSFGDYSRGRYFLGDDGLPMADSRTLHFRPSATNANWGPGAGNPDEGMVVDGFPPERNPLKLSALYQALAPFWYTNQFPANYPAIVGDPCGNPNPENGLIPPYRVAEYAVAHDPYQPGLVTSALDTLRFFDAWGNRTWDRITQPTLKALAYTQNTFQPDDRTRYLTGYNAADDTLRQYGQIVYRRLAYTHADVGVNAGGVQDSVRILAMAQVHYRGLGNIPQTLNALPDTSGGFPRVWNGVWNPEQTNPAAADYIPNAFSEYRSPNAGGTYDIDFAVTVRNPVSANDGDPGARTPLVWTIDANQMPVDPSNENSLPNTGVKITVRPNIPRAIDIRPSDPWAGTNGAQFLRLDITEVDGYGNTVDDNEKFKFELSPFGQLSTGIPYRLNGTFDSLVTTNPNVTVSGMNIDSGRVSVGGVAIGTATRVLRPATGSNNVGAYRVRVRSTWSFPDRNAMATDLHFPLKLDPFPTGNPASIGGFSHANIIPDGSPNNNFGVWFGPDALVSCALNPVPQMNAGFGNRIGQTTAMDSTDVIWDGSNWTYVAGPQPKVELVCGEGDDALVVGSVGTFTLPGQPKNIYDKFYVRITDVFGNPMDIAPYFYPNANKVHVELPSNPYYIGLFTHPDPNIQIDKVFFASVSPNVAFGGAGGSSNPTNINARFNPVDPANPNTILDAVLVDVLPGQTLPGITGDVRALNQYSAVRFFIRAPENVKTLSLAGTDTIQVRAHLTLASIPNAGDVSISSALCSVPIVPDVVSSVEIFKSNGKPAGTSVPMPWAPGNPNDFLANNYPTGTPQNPAESNEFYSGYFFRALTANPPSTDVLFPSPIEPGGNIGGFQADDVSLDGDATAPIPVDTVTVSEHNNQIRIVARLLDQYRNPIGGRLVKFHVESETLPITWPKTALQNNAQRGGFGEFGQTYVADDTLKRTTIGDTAQAGWVTAFFNSGRVGWQIVRVALTPDTMAFDLSDIGRNLGEGTIVGPSMRGFAPRVIIPIYQKPDTTVRVEIFPYTAGVSSPIPLPADLVEIQSLEHPSIYFRAGEQDKWSPFFKTYSANPFFVEYRATRFGRVANTNIRPYIPDTLNMTESDPMNVNTITAGRKVTLLAREYDKFGNLVDNSTDVEDTARVRFRMWSGSWGAPAAPYNTSSYAGGAQISGGTIAPTGAWTEDSYGPMRKIRVRHTQISNLVAGVHINQTGFFTALEFPTPKLANSDFFFEATATGVLPGIGAVEIDRDTTKVVAVVKNPTRFDVLRSGQEFPRGSFGFFPLTGTPEARGITAPQTITLPPGTDVDNHWVDAVSVDNILVSQVYRRNVDPGVVGLYEIVDENNVPLDAQGEPLFVDANADFNPNFEVDEYSGLPKLLYLNAHNNQNPFTSPNVSYNILNGNAPPGFSMPNGYRTDGVIFDVSIAGGGDGIGANIAPGDRRPVLFRVSPIWENNPPTGGNAYDLAMFTGNNAQPGQTRAYPDGFSSLSTRLYADTIYTFEGTFSQVPNKATDTRVELMGTRSDLGFAGRYTAGTEFDRRSRIGLTTWGVSDWHIAGFPRNPADVPSVFRTRTGAALIGGETAQGFLFNGDYNRRVALVGPPPGQPRAGSFSRETVAPGYIAPGAHLRLIDSTAGEVLDLRVVAPDLMDMAGNPVDDTASYDQGKYTITRRANRIANGFWHYDDTYFDNNPADIQGPNYTTQGFLAEQPFTGSGRPRNYGGVNANEASITRRFFAPTTNVKMQHTFVMIPYRIAYLSIFPSSYDVSQGTNLMDQLPLGIVPRQADIDTLPRVQLVPPLGADLTKWEMFTRLYGQIVHGATQNQIPSNQGPYARPDTIFRDLIYTYAVTPYDRYGNLNVRDTMFVQVGARSTDWDFLDLSGADPQLMVRSGGVYLRAIPRNTPVDGNYNYRRDSIRLFNPIPTSSSSRNAYLGIKPDDKRLGLTVGEAGGQSITHGLLPANVIATRPVDVKAPYAPAPFTLNTNTVRNRDLFRIDWVGCDPRNEPDTLKLFWEKAEWQGTDANHNNPNDVIRYEWYAIIDSVGANGGANVRTVSMIADDNGEANMITIDGETLRQLLFRPGMQPQPNADSLVMRIKWFVRAYSQTGLETFSDTAGATVRNNPFPTPGLIVSINRPPVGPMDPIQPTNNDIIGGLNPTSPPIDFIWNTATDVNIRKGRLIGGFKTYNSVTQMWETVMNPGTGLPARDVDTILYQFVGRVVRTFPAGKGAPLGTVIVKTAGNLSAIQLDATNDLDALFAGFSPDTSSTSADSVIVEWMVYAKDFGSDDDGLIPYPFKDGIWANDSLALNNTPIDTSRYSWTSCQPHWIQSGPYTVNLSKLGQGGVEIDPSAATASGPINKVVGEEVCFTLVAKDGDGNIIRDWNITGTPTTLTLMGSTANTDTSVQTWNNDPDGYTYAIIKESGQPLTFLPPDQWTIPPDAFVNGVATICLVHTKADTGVTITVTPTFSGLNQVSATMNFTADAIANYLIEVTSATGLPDQVYQFRKYEIVVSPRDRYLNVSNMQVKTYFSARFPGEFVNSQPGFSDIFSGAVFISGPTNYFLASTDDRVKGAKALQQITAYSDNNNYKSSSNPYEILRHEPMPFDLQNPADQTYLKLATAATQEVFDWTVSTDPYTNIQISRFTSEIGNDVVTYEVYFLDSTSLTKKVVIDSDNLGLGNTFTTTHGQLKGITEQIAGGNILIQPMVWKVRATDGLYETWSTPDNADPQGRPGFRLTIDNNGIVSTDPISAPSSFALEQNFPNPFNPTTNISYSVATAGQVNVMVYDLLGNLVKTLVNDVQEPGQYKVIWDATNEQGSVVPTGNYILKMVSGDFSQTRKMTLVK